MEHKVFNIAASESELCVEIYGAIGEGWWEEGNTLQSVLAQIKAEDDGKKAVRVKINSLGGDVNDALAIYEALRSMDDRVTTECSGMCASAATIIAMAGARRKMSRYGFFLIHKCSSIVAGNENDLQEELETQRKINETLTNLYVERTGSSREKIEELMERNHGEGGWLNSEEAMEYGFITEEIGTASATAQAAFRAIAASIGRLFNNKKVDDMKKNIEAFAALAALLAVKEVDGKGDCALLTLGQLESINDHIEELAAQAKTLDEEKGKAEQALAAAEGDRDQLQAKVDELQAIIDKMPNGAVGVAGEDTHDDEPMKDWLESETYASAVEQLKNY